KPIGQLIRSITGLSMNAAKQAFSKYLDESSMDSRQIYFVNQIIEHLVQNGVIDDSKTLLESPFSDMGGIAEIFGTDMDTWNGIKGVLASINRNAGLLNSPGRR
ncbi:MAG: restriction endonuclease subunit R, partial [Candidatus Methanomethylophilaceae archaeon]|nr:restriction endonuclease subunit R [Candidatus Methanomethylophilaceae archaeon]